MSLMIKRQLIFLITRINNESDNIKRAYAVKFYAAASIV